MQVCCHGNQGAYETFKKLFDFLEIPTAAHYKAPAKRVQHFIKHHTTFVAHCCMLFNRV